MSKSGTTSHLGFLSTDGREIRHVSDSDIVETVKVLLKFKADPFLFFVLKSNRSQRIVIARDYAREHRIGAVRQLFGFPAQQCDPDRLYHPDHPCYPVSDAGFMDDWRGVKLISQSEFMSRNLRGWETSVERQRSFNARELDFPNLTEQPSFSERESFIDTSWSPAGVKSLIQTFSNSEMPQTLRTADSCAQVEAFPQLSCQGYSETSETASSELWARFAKSKGLAVSTDMPPAPACTSSEPQSAKKPATRRGKSRWKPLEA